MNRRRSTKQLEMFEDIPIPPPRTAERWYCTKCGQPGAEPEPGMLTVDPRYAIGYCDCTQGRRSRVSGYKREMVNLVADFAWHESDWRRRQNDIAEKNAFEKGRAGLPLKPEEAAASQRYRIKNGLE